ncbi:acyl transferase/acyl hydrolase/lysophospholipase [Podospora conica]|nr:acyl transferase/acyl hydrolase/lysophospholipase [Schizothecium conicum]
MTTSAARQPATSRRWKSSRGALFRLECAAARELGIWTTDIMSSFPQGRPPPWRILSLDGGGVRGLAELLILQRIFATMEAIVADELGRGARTFHPCDVFDLVGGTSTGGLIAILLGRLRLSISKSIAVFRSLSERIFPTPKQSWLSKHVAIASGKSVYDASIFETELRRIVDETTGNPETTMMVDSDPNAACRVFVCATRMHTTSSILLRTYTPRDPGQASHPVKIREAARATSAAPPLFDPISIRECGITLLDGAFRLNNPINETLAEAYDLDPARGFGCILSIGTGVSDMPSLENSRHLLNVAQACVRISLDCEDVAAKFIKGPTGAKINAEGRYFRFNVPHKLHSVNIYQWEKYDAVQEYVETYLETMGSQLDKCARTLLIMSGYRVRERAAAQLDATVAMASSLPDYCASNPLVAAQEKDGVEVRHPGIKFSAKAKAFESNAFEISDSKTVSNLNLGGVTTDNVSLSSFPDAGLRVSKAMSPSTLVGSTTCASVSPMSAEMQKVNAALVPIAEMLAAGSQHLSEKEFVLAFDQFKAAIVFSKNVSCDQEGLDGFLVATHLGMGEALIQAASAKQRNPEKAMAHLRSAGQHVTRAVAYARGCSGRNSDGAVFLKQAELSFLVIAITKAEVECFGGAMPIDKVQVECLADKVDGFLDGLSRVRLPAERDEVRSMAVRAEAWRNRLREKHGAARG